DGTLALAKPAGVNALAANLIIGDGVGAGSASVLSLASEQIQNGFGVTMYSDGLWDLNGQTETIGYLQTPPGLNTAEVRLTGSGSQLITGAALSSTFGGSITAAGSLVKQGPTTFTLSNSNTYTGTTTINAGALALTGSL